VTAALSMMLITGAEPMEIGRRQHGGEQIGSRAVIVPWITRRWIGFRVSRLYTLHPLTYASCVTILTANPPLEWPAESP
jgi:hypothetical protein